jgi:alkyl sulfatase BDS1-like metallo-beta-lactamase superfamily hydrolase
MSRRSAYMFGAALSRGPEGQIGAGLGQSVPMLEKTLRCKDLDVFFLDILIRDKAFNATKMINMRNVFAGTAMSRRSAYMFGAALSRGPEGQIGAGLGLSETACSRKP